jgi:hypothetical protein
MVWTEAKTSSSTIRTAVKITETSLFRLPHGVPIDPARKLFHTISIIWTPLSMRVPPPDFSF